MKKLENFSRCLRVLKSANFANDNEFYKAGIIAMFNLTFELAWKALQYVLRLHGVVEAATGSPREILQLGYKFGFIEDSAAWLAMLKRRNTLAHVCSEDDADELISSIRDSFIDAFDTLEKILKEKFEEVGESG